MPFDVLDFFEFFEIFCFRNELFFSRLDFGCSTFHWQKKKNIRNIHVVLTNQIAGIWYFKDKGQKQTILKLSVKILQL